jgi:hypothetical protein
LSRIYIAPQQCGLQRQACHRYVRDAFSPHTPIGVFPTSRPGANIRLRLWRAFIFQQMPMFVHVELIDETTAQTLLADLEALNAKGEFSASFIVQTAVGTK